MEDDSVFLDGESYVLSEEGKAIACGLISAFCHGHNIEQAADLNLIDVESAKVTMLIIAAQAGIVKVDL